MWTYLNTPFLFALDGVKTEEIEPWRENGETWRRLKVTFPPNIASHSTVQTFFFGAKLAAGNCCVLKLSIGAQGVVRAVARPGAAVSFEPDAVATVAGHREETTELLNLPFDFIFFTGSTSTGKVIARAAAESLRRPVLLELGGKIPRQSMKPPTSRTPPGRSSGARWPGAGNGVQSPGYAYVHESVAEAFVSDAKAALIALYGKDPKANPDYSRIISAREVSRLSTLIDPSKVVAGGRSDPDARYLDPTIVYPVSWDDRIMEEEIFGLDPPDLDLLGRLTRRLAGYQPVRGLWRLSSSAAIKTRLTASPANCHSAGARPTRSTSTCSW